MIPTRPPRTMSSGPQRSSFLYIILPVRLVSPNGQSWVCQQAHLSYLSYPFNYQPSLDPILQIALSSQSHCTSPDILEPGNMASRKKVLLKVSSLGHSKTGHASPLKLCTDRLAT